MQLRWAGGEPTYSCMLASEQNLLEAWFSVYWETSATVPQALERCNAASANEDEKALLEAMRAIGEQGPAISARKIGKFFSRKENRILAGMSFAKGDVLHKAQKWRITLQENAG